MINKVLSDISDYHYYYNILSYQILNPFVSEMTWGQFMIKDTWLNWRDKFKAKILGPPINLLLLSEF